MNSVTILPPIEERPGDGIVRLRTGEYRIHKAWSDRPHVFVRYNAHGKLIERKLPRSGNTAMKVIDRFRHEVRQESH